MESYLNRHKMRYLVGDARVSSFLEMGWIGHLSNDFLPVDQGQVLLR